MAIQIYNTPEEKIEENQIVYNQEVKKPLTRLESAERQSVQDWKDEIERRKKGVGKMEEQEYQGPVPEGYDEEHFRKTGETILLEDGKK